MILKAHIYAQKHYKRNTLKYFQIKIIKLKIFSKISKNEKNFPSPFLIIPFN